jgi:hypothetical protein
MRAQPLVTFEVDEAFAEDRWASVIADATYEELVSEDDRAHAHRVLYGDSFRTPSVLTITILCIAWCSSGKQVASNSRTTTTRER